MWYMQNGTITAIVSLALSQIYQGLRVLHKLGMTDSKQNCPSVGMFFSIKFKIEFERFETDWVSLSYDIKESTRSH